MELLPNTTTIIENIIAPITYSIVAGIVYFVNRRWTIYQENALIYSELKDLYRHLNFNKAVLEDIDLKKGIPVELHFKKLKIFKKAILFSSESNRNIRRKKARHLYRFKTELRNYNIEVDSLIECAKGKNQKKNEISKYLNLLISKTDYLMGTTKYLSENKLNYNNKRDANKIQTKLIYD